MLLRVYFKWLSMIFTTLLISEQIPLIKTIDAGPSEASQLLSTVSETVSEFANGVKDNIVEMVTRPSEFFHEAEHNQNSPVPEISQPPVEPSPELPPEPLQCPEPSPAANSTSQLFRMKGSRLILEVDLARIPKYEVLRHAIVWLAHWFGLVFPSGSGRDWVYLVAPAALGFFGGLGFRFGCLCGCLSRKKPPKAVEKIVPATVAEETAEEVQRIVPPDVYLESMLSQSYMMPWDFRHAPVPHRSKVSAQIAHIKQEHTDVNPTIERIAKKEEDADPLAVPASLSDSSWYLPGSPTQSSSDGFDLSSFDGFQPRPKVLHPEGLPDSLMGSFPSPSPSPEPNLPKISDPWINYTPDDQENRS